MDVPNIFAVNDNKDKNKQMAVIYKVSFNQSVCVEKGLVTPLFEKVFSAGGDPKKKNYCFFTNVYFSFFGNITKQNRGINW